jgi:thiamine pyrophosphate-dependent acetolactate synthase large subunit-like protein
MDSGKATSTDRPANLGNRQMGWGSDVIAETVRQLDLDYIALVPGASYRGFHDSLVNYLGNESPRMVVCLHEEHAVAIADGYGKALDRPMAAAVHSNVGLLHASMAIFNAWAGRSPIIIFGATGHVDAHRRRPWIEWLHTSKDQGGIVRDFVKWDDQPASPEAAVESVLRANQIARTLPYGPVYVCLDVGLQEDELKRPVVVPPVHRYAPPAPPAPSKETLEAVRAAFQKAKLPVIMVGRVSRDPEAWARRVKLAEALGATVITSSHNSAAFPTDHPQHLLPLGGERPDGPDAALVKQADLLLSLDWLDLAGFLRIATNEAQSQKPIDATVIQVSLDSYLFNGFNPYNQALAAVDIDVLSDPDVFVTEMLNHLNGAAMPKRLPAGMTHWMNGERAPARKEAAQLTEAALTKQDLARAWMKAHEAATAKGRKVTVTRTFLGWPGWASSITDPLDYMGKDAGGAVGNGPGHSVGVALALKDTGRVVVGLLGDGDYLMGVSALWTASRMRLPLLLVVANNNSYFNDEVHQERMAVARQRPVENKWIGQRIADPAPDIVGFAKAQGFEGETVSTLDALDAALAKGIEAVAAGGRVVIEVQIAGG